MLTRARRYFTGTRLRLYHDSMKSELKSDGPKDVQKAMANYIAVVETNLAVRWGRKTPMRRCPPD